MTTTKPSRISLSHWLRRALSPIWPVECCVCEKTLSKSETVMCLECLMDLPRYGRTRQIVNTTAPGGFVAVRSWFVYDPHAPAHTLIHRIKYRDSPRLARKLGREFGLELEGDNFLTERPVDVILPIPLHWTKHLHRSYNQAHEAALGIADVLGIEVSNNLYARRAHSSQTSRNRAERDANVRDIFDVARPSELNNKHIAVFDDVITTGATMFSAVRRILEVSHPASITLLSLGNTRLD